MNFPFSKKPQPEEDKELKETLGRIFDEKLREERKAKWVANQETLLASVPGLKMHETIRLVANMGIGKSTIITRVPGGWLYTYEQSSWHDKAPTYSQTTFVKEVI